MDTFLLQKHPLVPKNFTMVTLWSPSSCKQALSFPPCSRVHTSKSLEFPQRLFSLICVWKGTSYRHKLHGVLRLWRMHTCSVAWKMCFYFHNKGGTVVTKLRKNVKFVIFTISVKIVKSAASLWGSCVVIYIPKENNLVKQLIGKFCSFRKAIAKNRKFCKFFISTTSLSFL